MDADLIQKLLAIIDKLSAELKSAHKDSGGTAFQITDGPPGFGLRDWFAATVPLTDEEVSAPQAKAVMGCEPPNWDASGALSAVKWWAQAEARLRYINADAMLAAREASAGDLPGGQKGGSA